MAFVVALVGCGATEEVKESSTTALSAARSAVEEADEAQAATYAPSPWAQAREKLSAAEEALRAEKYQRAKVLAEEAQVDAELAEAQARAAVAEESVDDLQSSLEALRHEARRTGGAPAK
jgi:chromosome segregation ATPase